MDRLTLVAALAGAALLVLSMAGRGGLPLFWNVPSVGIVLGGTLAALCVQYSLSQMRSVARAVAETYFTRPPDVHALIEYFAALAEKSKRQQLLALEEDARQASDRFLRHGLQALVDLTPIEALQESLERELVVLVDRYRLGQGLFKSMSVIAPGFGMLGTLIGLIQMLSRFEDPTQIGPGLAVALVTTFYGSLLANLVALPVAGKLKLRGEEEARIKLMMLDGLLMLAKRATPTQMREALRTHLSPYMRQLVATEAGAGAEQEGETAAEGRGEAADAARTAAGSSPGRRGGTAETEA